MSGADANNMTALDMDTSSDLSATLMDPSSAFPPDATPTSEPQSSDEKDVLQGPSDLIPTTPTTSSSSPHDLSSAADPAQPASPQITRDVMNIESMSTDDDTEEYKAFLSTLRDEKDPQKIWEYCRKQIHELGASIDPTIELEEKVNEDICLILVPQSHRMQEYFNDLAYVKKILWAIHRRFHPWIYPGREEDDDYDRQMSVQRMISRIIAFMRDVVKREQGYGKYAEQVVYDSEDERCGSDGSPFFTIEDYDSMEDDGFGDEDGHDDH